MRHHVVYNLVSDKKLSARLAENPQETQLLSSAILYEDFRILFPRFTSCYIYFKAQKLDCVSELGRIVFDLKRETDVYNKQDHRFV